MAVLGSSLIALLAAVPVAGSVWRLGGVAAGSSGTAAAASGYLESACRRSGDLLCMIGETNHATSPGIRDPVINVAYDVALWVDPGGDETLWNMIDGNPATTWTPVGNPRTVTVELRFNTPVTVSEVGASVASGSAYTGFSWATTIRIEIIPDTGNGDRLEVTDLVVRDGTHPAVPTCPPMCPQRPDLHSCLNDPFGNVRAYSTAFEQVFG
jgi:hypothetical protein